MLRCGPPKARMQRALVWEAGIFRSCSSSPDNSFSSLEESPLTFSCQVRFTFLFSGSAAFREGYREMEPAVCLFPSSESAASPMGLLGRWAPTSAAAPSVFILGSFSLCTIYKHT